NRLAEKKRLKQEAKKASRRASRVSDADRALLDTTLAEKKRTFYTKKPDGAAGSAMTVMRMIEAEDTSHPFIAKIRYLVISEWFVNIIMFFITANVVVMMFDSYPPPPYRLTKIVTVLNQVFTVVFLVEFVLLHIALGPRQYWSKLATAFDGFIVITSILELLLANGSSVMMALRGFRLLRIFKLAKKWTSFRVLLKSIVHTVNSMGNFCILLGLMMFVFTLMGMSLFATKLRMDDEGRKIPDDLLAPWPKNQCPGGGYDCVPRSHFDTLLWSFITVFQILTGENWNTVMYDAVLAVGWGAVLFFIALVIFGQSVILNLFLAILMSKFKESSAAIREQEVARARSRSQLSALLRERKKMAGGLRLDEVLSPDSPQDSPSPRTVAVRSFVGKHAEGSPTYKEVLDASKADDPDGGGGAEPRAVEEPAQPGMIRHGSSVVVSDTPTVHRTTEESADSLRSSEEQS
ncbi:hypothetical protein FOZ63_005205, partial [Perkinsus olseni]